jgi:two-component system, OmpR family, response regulator
MKILVVEDNKKLARFLVRAMSEEGYIVDQVGDGATAIQQVQSITYDLVILDWMLPELDGLSVCRTLRGKGARVPILMLTARAEVSERIAGLDAGADDYLPKPFDLGELLARTRALTRRGASNDAVLRVGPLAIDRGERRALVDNKRIDLTPREFALLAYLAREAGRVVPRMEILAKVWEMTFDPGSNVIEVHVKNVREKLGAYAKMIETVRGIGYRCVAPAGAQGPAQAAPPPSSPSPASSPAGSSPAGSPAAGPPEASSPPASRPPPSTK